MGKFQSSVLVFSALLCLTLGWEPGTQYEYRYVGRSVAGMYNLKLQNAVIELHSLVIVQSVEENTIIVKLTEGRVKRNGNYLKNPYFGSGETVEDVEGVEDKIINPEFLGAPFAITHNKGSITGVKIGDGEPQWVVNYKKGIASQLQIDITGVRRDDPSINLISPKTGESTTFSTYEDSVTGDCSTIIAVSQLRRSQIFQSYAYKMGSFDAICKGKPVYKIVKTKEFNKCKSQPNFHYTTSSTYNCDFDKTNCGDFMQRTSFYEYLACGDNYPQLTVIHGSGFSDLLATPFGHKTDELVNSVVLIWSLEKKENISSRLTVSSSAKEHKSLSYVHDDFNQLNQDGTPAQPNLHDAYFKSPAPVAVLSRTILDVLRSIERDLKERSDAEKDNLERLVVISRVLPMFSLENLRALYQEIKSQNSVVIKTLFIDTVVVAGTNPSVMLIKELIESEQLKGFKANFALSALGHYVKTPTHELLSELVNLLKSGPVQSSKSEFQTALSTVADLLNNACGSRISASKRYPVSVLGNFCDSKDDVIINQFLPILVRELEASHDVFDRIVVLSAFGSLGVEEIVPILLPIIRGSPGKFDETAERLRAILSLHRVVYTAPEKIHPILTSLANNQAERPEIRMASIGLLLMSNAPLSIYQKIAVTTWIDSSRQVGAFVSNLIHSLAKAPATTPLLEKLTEKARVALSMVKPASYGLTFSLGDIQSSHLDEGITVLMHTVSLRDTDHSWPVYFANRYNYQLGPLNREPLSVYFWNFNMDDVWQNVFSKVYGHLTAKYGSILADRKRTEKNSIVKRIWDELNASARPADKRVGLLQLNLLGSINRFVNLEKMIENIPNYMASIIKYQNKPFDVSLTKFCSLGEYNVRFATDLGLPMRYLFTMPILTSAQGVVNADGKNGVKSNVNAGISFKINAEVRVDLPFNGNYIATGVDVHVATNAPNEIYFNYNNAELEVTWDSPKQVTDLFYYHVKPYTITRSNSESAKPTLEDPSVHLISVNDKPIKREFSVGDMIGFNVRLIEESDLAHSDNYSWREYFNKHDIGSLLNLGFIPLDVRARQYILRYDPSGTKAKTFTSSYSYQYAAKTGQNSVVYESGSSQSKKMTNSEVISYKPIVSEFRPLLGRLFDNLDSGNARLMRASFTTEQTDGTLINFKSVVGMAMNNRYNKDLLDWQAEYSTTAPSQDKKVNYAICYNAVRKWNNPPTHGFSQDVLTLTEEDNIGLGPECERKIKLTAKVTRDEEAGLAAINSPAGQQCLKDIESGFKYGSPACTEARRLDHTYNNYELVSEVENMSERWLQWARSHTTWLNHILEPFIVKHVHNQKNSDLRASWTIQRDPITGDSDMTFVRPHETVVLKNVRWTNHVTRFSPLSQAYGPAFFPLIASSNYILNSVAITTAGVSDAKCYIGSDAVYTYDGAHYNYTIDSCPHVLLTDCHRKSDIAITARRGDSGQKIVIVVYDKDTFELDPNGSATINGVVTAFSSLEKTSHIEIRATGSTSVKTIIFPMADGGVILDIRSIQFYLKVHGSHIELSAPVHLRGRTCGLCGDFNQEVEDEFKTPSRCAVSSGDLMAASFKLKSDKDCSLAGDDFGRRLKEETETCESVDQLFHTHLPDYIL